MLISFPVCGFLPFLAALSETEKVPNPTKATLSFLLNAFPVTYKNDSNALLASAFDKLAPSAIASTNSDLFML